MVSCPLLPRLGRGDGGSALERPSGSSAPPPRRSSPRQFDDAPSDGSFRPREDLVRRDRDAFATSLNRGAYRGRGGSDGGSGPFVVRPVNLRHATPGSGPGAGGQGARRGGGGGGRGGLAGRGGRGGAQGGAGRGGGAADKVRKPPAYLSEAFLAADAVNRPQMAPSTLPSNEDLYSADDYLLSGASDKPLSEGPAEVFPVPSPFYAKLRSEVYAEAPTSGLRVLKHRTNAEHLLVPSLGPAALAAGQALVGELPMLLARGAKREDQLLARQTVEEFDPEAGVWLAPGKVDYSAEIARRFDPYRPGKPHPRRVFRLTTQSTLAEPDDAEAREAAKAAAAEAATSPAARRRARVQVHRASPSVQIVVLEHPPVPAASLESAEHAELLAQIDAERVKGTYERWSDPDALAPLAARFAETDGREAFRNGRQAALALNQIGLAWAGNNMSGRERELVKSVVEGLVKQ